MQPEPTYNSVKASDDADIMTAAGQNLWLDRGFTWMVRVLAFSTVAVLLGISWVVLQQALPAIQKYGLKFLWDREWVSADLIFGALPFIYGTVVSSAIALLLAVPVGLAVALVTSEDFLPAVVRSPLAFVVELIAAIPSVVVGLWGIVVLIPFLRSLQEFLYQYFRWIPLFNTEAPSGNNMLTAGVILAIMILPTMAAITRDVLQTIPKELRSASMALGSTRWETIFNVLLSYGASGIVGASILALGRALGETMAVTMVIGNTPTLSLSILDPAYTIPAVLANEFAEALDPLHVGALLYLGLLLFIVTLIVNIAAVLMVRLFSH